MRKRWRKAVYPAFVQSATEGLPKWTKAEDVILYKGSKVDIDWDSEARLFFPIRTVGSMRARWRRIKDHYMAK